MGSMMRVSKTTAALDAPVVAGARATDGRGCREDVGACAGDGRVVSSHVTSDGVVIYVRCACGGIRITQLRVR